MKRSNGFGLGWHPSPLRASALALGQADISAAGGEPDLARALAHLTPGERDDYRNWGVPEKTLFLLGYQYLAVGSAKGFKRPDGTRFDGFLPQGITEGFMLLSAASNYVTGLGSLSDVLDQMTSILKGANDTVEENAQSAVFKYRFLRDRVAWEMANAGVTVAYDIVGDDPANRGVIYQRTVGENRAPDLDAVFSFKTPAQMYRIGKDLEKRYADLGVPFERAQLGAGALPILAIVIAVIVGILMFFYLFWNHADRAKLNDTTATLIANDPKLTPAEKADLLAKFKASDSWWNMIFGDFPWTTLVITAGIALIAFFALPPLLARKVKP